MNTLFKDRITKRRYDAEPKDFAIERQYEKQIDQLLRALQDGDDALKRLLLETAEPREYTQRGKYSLGKHDKDTCSGVTGSGQEEDQLCKCLYFYNRAGGRPAPAKCEKCASPRQYTLVGPYRIMDYQVPAHYDVPHVGKIDMVLTDGLTPPYATEVKPPKGNTERLLRMVAEILTYTLGTPETQYQRAIAFFENSPQNEEYEKPAPRFQELLVQAGITVFRFEARGEGAFEICKL